MSTKYDKRGTAQKDDPKNQLSEIELGISTLKGPPVLVFALVTGVFIGILLFYLFFSRQPFWIDPLIGNAVKATVGAQTAPAIDREPLPTYTPYPTHTPEPRLPTYTPYSIATAAAPSARITSPEYTDGPVPVKTNVVTEYKHIPEGSFLWVAVRIPKVRPVWYVYPQLLDGIPEPVNGSGTLATNVQLGIEGAQDSGEPFNIVILLLDEAAQGIFSSYAQGCIENPTDPARCSGLSLPDAGVQILDFATVVRE